VNLARICSAVPEIFEWQTKLMKKKQTKKSQTALATEPYLRAVNVQKAEVKPKPTVNCKNSHCHIIVHNCTAYCTIQQRTDLIIFPLMLQAVDIAQIVSTGRKGIAVLEQRLYIR